jgi:hypothetical protein
MAKIVQIMGERVLLMHDARLRTREVPGPKGGVTLRYQVTSKDPVRDPWFVTAWEAIEGREGTLSTRGLEAKRVRDDVRYLLSKRN